MDLRLADQRALVTGGTRGIGRTVVETLLDEGGVSSFTSGTDLVVDGALTRGEQL